MTWTHQARHVGVLYSLISLTCGTHTHYVKDMTRTFLLEDLYEKSM